MATRIRLTPALAHELATHWLDCLYRPTIAAARARELDELLAPLPEGELFLLMHASERPALANPGSCDELQAAATEPAAGLAGGPAAAPAPPAAALKAPLAPNRTR